MVRVMLAHTWRLFREALRAVLAHEADLDEVADADEVLHHASRTRPDVIVLDVALPGVVPVHKLGQELLDTPPQCMVLVLLDRRTHGGAGVTLTRLAPRVGLLGTDASPADLVTAIR